MLLTFIKLSFLIKILVLSIFERPFYTCLTFNIYIVINTLKAGHAADDFFFKYQSAQIRTDK